MNVLDNKGSTWNVSFHTKYSPHEFTDIRGGIDFRPYPAVLVTGLCDDKDSIMSWWHPIFVDWFIGEYIAPERLPHQWTEHFT